MRQEYSELGKVGGLTVGDTMMQNTNLVQEIQNLKIHSEQMLNNMREEFRHGFQAFYVN